MTGTVARVSLRSISMEYPILKSQRRLFRPRSWFQNGERGKGIRDITIDVIEGDRVAILGANGAGKTTLLRVISGVLRPSSGSIETSGTVAFLLDQGFGMDQELSGRLNTLAYGVVRQMERKQRRDFIEQVREFSELGAAFERPVRTYSLGMTSRLVFSMSTIISPDVLIIDEALGAGDEYFQAKARDRISDLVNNAGVVITASHSREFIQSNCTRGLLLEHGRLVADGPIDQVLDAYSNLNQASRGK